MTIKAGGPRVMPKNYKGRKDIRYHPTKGFRPDKGHDPSYKPIFQGLQEG
jgi:hypothetical protein